MHMWNSFLFDIIKTSIERAPTEPVGYIIQSFFIILFYHAIGIRFVNYQVALTLQNILFHRIDNIYIFFLWVIMVQGVLKEFCQTTSIHGLSSIVEAKNSIIKRIVWAVIFVISISYAGIQLKDNVDNLKLRQRGYNIKSGFPQTAK